MRFAKYLTALLTLAVALLSLAAGLGAVEMRVVWNKITEPDPETGYMDAILDQCFPTSDGNIIYSYVTGTNLRSDRFHVIKADTRGEELWHYILVYGNPDSLCGMRMISLQEGGSIIGAYKGYHADKKITFIKLDDNGEEVWTRYCELNYNANIREMYQDNHSNIIALCNPSSLNGWTILSATSQGRMINYIYYDQFIPYTCFCADHLDRLFLGGYSHIMQIDTCCNNLNWFTYQIGRIHTMYPLPAGLLIAGNVYNEDDQVFICKLNDSLEIEQQSWFGSEHYEDVVFDALAFPSGELAFCGRSNRAGAWFQIMDTDFNIRDTLFTWGEGIAEFYRIAPVSYYDVILYGWTTPGWEYPDKKIMLTRLTVPLQIKTDDQSRSFEFQLLAAYPNPFNSSVSICLSLTEPQSFEILLNDWLGRRIFRTQLEYSAGSHIYTLPQEISSSLPSGQYALNLNGINRREALFLVKIK